MTSAPTSHLLPVFSRAKVAFESGEGAWLLSTEGERYLDFGAGVAVTSLGHAHPALVKALQEQAAKLWHTSNLYQMPEAERLASRLCENSFADVVFFVNSGAEALECAIKMARKYHSAKNQPERYHVITFEGAFHGRTLATIAAGGQQKYIEGFGPKAEGFDQVPFGDVAALKAALTPQTGAILIEPLQGEGGIRAVTPNFLKLLREICDQNGLLLIFDEVQCGVGRLGHFFAHEASGVPPDILALAKGLAGGFPLGACLATYDAALGMVPGSHGSTFGGNPLAMACGNAVLDIVKDDPAFMEDVRDKGLILKQQLAELKDSFPDIIEEIRGQGLMLGIKTRVINGKFVEAAMAEYLLTVPAGDNVVRIIPPLTVTRKDIATAHRRLTRAALRLRSQCAQNHQ